MSMMSPRKLKKKKEREKLAKKKVLERREALRAPRREENQLRKRVKRISKLQKDMGELSVWADDVLLQLNDKTLSQIEQNAKILKALEAEYEAERKKKESLNEDLESKGLVTLEEKIGHLHQQLVDQQKTAGVELLGEEMALLKQQEKAMGVGGSAEAKFATNKPKSNKPKREIAEVEVIKAPGFGSKDKTETTAESEISENLTDD